MRRSRAFILTEIMTGLLLQATFIVALCGVFYMLTSYGATTQQILTAKQHGEKVIAYVDQRIKNLGLGLWKCHTPAELANAMYTLTTKNDSFKKPFTDILLPIEIKWDNKKKDAKIYDETHKIIKYHGNILTMLYARKEIAKSIRLIITGDKNLQYKIISLDKGETKNIRLLAGNYSYITKSNFINQAISRVMPEYDLRVWAVMESAGLPVYIGNWNSTTKSINMTLHNRAPDYAEINPGSELLYLECEKIFTGKDASTENEGLRIQKTVGNEWGKEQPHEASILEIYAVLGTEADKDMPHVLNLYVLASGGLNGKNDNPKPKTWPDAANWKDDYAKHTLYVARGTWKLHNLELFRWNE